MNCVRGKRELHLNLTKSSIKGYNVVELSGG